MSPRIILSPDARAEFESAARWYLRQEVDLSRRFEAEVSATLWRIARYPHSFVRVADGSHRASMRRFPYSIYFTFRANRVLVLSIRHQRRAGIGWTQRKNNWQVDDD